MSGQTTQQDSSNPSNTSKDDAQDKGSTGQQQQQNGSNEDNSWRRKAEAAQKELDKFKKAQMSDLERTQAERDEARREAAEATGKLKTEAIKSQFSVAAAKAGCLDTEDLFKVANLSTIGEDGKGIDKLIEDLQKSKPHFFGKVLEKKNLGSGGTGNGDGTSQPNQRINDEIRRFWRGG